MEQILDDFRDDERELRQYEMASKGQRFANYMIDIIIYYFLSFGLGTVTANTGSFSNSILLSYLLSALIITAYYFLLENFTGGKSIGKFITGTRAVNIDNSSLEPTTALVRSLVRVVPFEAFSYLGSSPTGWHDDWSKTKVIVDRDWQG